MVVGHGPIRIKPGSIVKLSGEYSGGTDHTHCVVIGYQSVWSVADGTVVHGIVYSNEDKHEVYKCLMFGGKRDVVEVLPIWPVELAVQ